MKKISLLLGILIVTLSACKKEETTPQYLAVDVTKIELTYPTTTPTGGDWDDFTNGYYPDLFVKITDVGSSSTPIISPTIENESTGIVVWYNSNAPLVTYEGTEHVVNFDVYDYDSLSSNDFIGGVNLKFGKANSYAKTITSTANGVTVTFTLNWR